MIVPKDEDFKSWGEFKCRGGQFEGYSYRCLIMVCNAHMTRLSCNSYSGQRDVQHVASALAVVPDRFV